ncbi:hypothetical protein ACJX0J_025616 [Zea mays]
MPISYYYYYYYFASPFINSRDCYNMSFRLIIFYQVFIGRIRLEVETKGLRKKEQVADYGIGPKLTFRSFIKLSKRSNYSWYDNFHTDTRMVRMYEKVPFIYFSISKYVGIKTLS